MCRECYNTRRRKYYESNQSAKNALRREYEARPEVRSRRLELRKTPERQATERKTRIRYKSKPDVVVQLRLYREAHESKISVRARMIFRAAETRAIKNKLPFTITQQWVQAKLEAGFCEVTGLPFEFGKPKGRSRRNPYCPSIDQIAAGNGYTETNSRVVLVAVNLALCDWGLEQFLHIANHAIAKQKLLNKTPAFNFA